MESATHFLNLFERLWYPFSCGISRACACNGLRLDEVPFLV